MTIDKMLEAFSDHEVKSVTYFLSPRDTTRITRQHKMDRRESSITFVITIGRPNYAARQFIKQANKAGEPSFPIKKLQYKFYPAIRKAA